jgi:uncharacterized protein with HEPN domain
VNESADASTPADEAKIRRVIADIDDFARSAGRIVARGRDAFFDPVDDTQRRAGKSLIIDLSAAADDLPEWFRSQHRGVPWRELRATRNFAAHDYRNVNQEVMWRVLETELPRISRLLHE